MELKRLAEEGWEALFRALFEQSTEAIFVLDAAGRIVDLNLQASDSLGRVREELIGRSPVEFDACWNQAFPQGFDSRQGCAGSVCFQSTHRRKDGAAFPVDVRVLPVEQRGHRLALLVARDLSERANAEQALRASEECFRTFVELSFDVYWESDSEHRFTRQEFSRRLADAPIPGSEIGKKRWEVPYVEPDEDAWRAHRATLDAHLPFRDFEMARPTAAGGKRYVSVSGFPVFDGSGRFLGYRGVGRHITHLKRADAEHWSHVWFLESMDRINRAIHAGHDVQGLASEVLQAALEIFACDRVCLLQPCDPQAPTWRAVAERTSPQCQAVFEPGTDVAMDPGMAALFAAASSSHRPVLLLPAPLADRCRARSLMAMVLRPSGAPPYLLGLHQYSHERTWTEDEKRLFQEIARRFTDALTSVLAFSRMMESERRLEQAQHIAGVGWWERDLLTNRLLPSDESCRIFGIEPADLSQWHDRWFTLLHPDDRAGAMAAVQAAAAGGPRYDVEYRVIRPDGSLRVVHSQADVTRDGSGRPIRLFGVMQDITELRSAEQELRASEARFRTVFDRATDAFFLLDTQLNVVDANRQACDSLGFSRDELIGMHPRDWDVDLDEAYIRRLAIQAGPGRPLTFETRHRRKDGTVFPVEVRTGAFRREDTVYYLALARDITERKRAEEALRASEVRFRTVFDHAMDAFFLLDEQVKVVDANRQACERLGYSRDELIGMHPRQFDAALDDRAIALLAARAGSGEAIMFETLHKRRDGTAFPVEIRSGTFREGDRLLYLAIARDITERKLAEEAVRGKDHALQMARAELARVSRVVTMGELTASIAHEVNQPLGAMVANAAAAARWLSADPPEAAKARRALQSISDDGRRASEVIRRIRALVQRRPLRMAMVGVNQTIGDVLALAQQELRSNGIALSTQLSEDVPPVLADRIQLQQVLLNLIVNAIEAMSATRDRPRELTITSGADGPDGVQVQVRDTGPGLAREHADRLFEAFYTTKPEGLGIGLSISRSIIEAHGGRLSAGPNVPCGAVFQLSLPVTREGDP